MSHPLHIPYGAWAEGPDPVVVTAERACWGHAALRVLHLEPVSPRTIRTGGEEMVVLPLSGSCTVECEGRRFEVSGRPDPFSRVTDFVYLPVDSEAVLRSELGGRFALPSARAGRRLAPAYGPAESVPVEVRGKGQATRQLTNFCDPGSFETDKLTAVECLTPAGNWSSYPPHKHDAVGPDEAVLEEIYYFETKRSAGAGDPRSADGFALLRLYTSDADIDLCEEVRSGDVVLVPRGYHGPSMTAPGYDLYHLNVLAGPGAQRSMAFCDDPSHHWVRESWESEPPDPRVPMTDATGRRDVGSERTR